MGLRCRRPPLLFAGLAVLVLGIPGGAHAQSAPADPSGHPFRSLAGSPLEPIHRLAPVHISRDSREGWVILADLGDRLPFWIKRAPEGRFELAAHLGGAAFSRFDLEDTSNEFLEVHYRVGFALRARYRAVAIRGELFHVSSHLGDEFLVRTGTEPISTSREAVEVLIQGAPLDGLMVYGGGGLVLRSTADFRRASLRGGVEWTRPGGLFYASGEAFSWAELDWDPAIALEAGIAPGPHVRLGVTFGTGPSRAEQFFRETEQLVGFSFSFRR